MFTKRAIIYEHSPVSTQMTKAMAVSMAYLVIIYPYSAHMCILSEQTKVAKNFPTLFCKKMIFRFLSVNKWFFFVKQRIFFTKMEPVQFSCIVCLVGWPTTRCEKKSRLVDILFFEFYRFFKSN